jgi:hypothetical protein
MNKQTTTIYIDNLVSESKQFLQKLKNNEDMKSSGIRIEILNKKGEKHNILMYEQQIYVVLVPHALKEKALLYGNWDEAILASQKLLLEEHSLQKGHQLTLTAYDQVV